MTQERARFPHFSEVPAPPGAEGWEDMYPYYLVPSAETRDAEESRLWFADTMHWSRGALPFDSIGVEAVALGAGQSSTRMFVLPAALGLDVRIQHGYVYVSPVPVTDPAEVARRATLFPERAGHYYDHWEELYARWKEKVAAVISRMKALSFAPLPEVEPLEVVTEGRGRSTAWDVVAGYHQLIDDFFLVWQYHFEFLHLGYGGYVPFFEFCRHAFPEISEQAIARMVSGVDVLTFRPDDELRGLARLSVDLQVDDVVLGGGPPAAVFAELGESEAGRTWLAAYDAAKDPWFDYFAEYGFAHDQETWLSDPAIPLGAIARYAARLRAGEDVARPVDRLRKERDEIVDGYRSLLGPEEVPQFDALLGLARRVFPYIEEHNIFVEHWTHSAFWQKAWEIGDLLLAAGFTEQRDDVFYLNRFELDQVLFDVVESWAVGVAARGRQRWATEVLRRRRIVAALAAAPALPAYGPVPDEVTDPIVVMDYGVTTERIRSWLGRRAGGADSLAGIPGSPGAVEGRARVLRSERDLRNLQPGEILVCPTTAPSWTPVFSLAGGVVTDIGGMMSHAAIVCREYGLPAVVGTGFATTTLRTGDRVRVDGDAGTVTVVGQGDA
jgi:pyruvate,water dikinase